MILAMCFGKKCGKTLAATQPILNFLSLKKWHFAGEVQITGIF